MPAIAVTAFNQAIVRRPAATVSLGLRAVDRGSPSFAAVLAEHDAYVTALQAAGLAVEILPALPDFPDSLFVEDPALVFHEGAILLRPGVATRAGETAALAPVLRRRFERVLEIVAGRVDGGDVLTLPERVMIGLSARTDAKGATALVGALAQLDRKGEIHQTPAGVLHFKSDCALLDDDTILATRRLAASGVFAGWRVISVPDGEEAAANALRINGSLLLGADYPATAELLAKHGFTVTPLATSEIAKIDAGLSCMSLRWHN